MNDVKENSAEAVKKVPKIPLKSALCIFFVMLAVIICLSAATIILALKSGNDSEEDSTIQEYVPVVNEKVYDFYSEEDTIILELNLKTDGMYTARTALHFRGQVLTYHIIRVR